MLSRSSRIILKNNARLIKRFNSTNAAATTTTATPPTPTNLVEVFVDDKVVQVPAGSVIIQACAEAGVDIPRFCYHERLAIAGNCRMCLVQVEKMPKLVASCAQPVAPGMKIITQSEMVKKGREGVMEFLLANHPLDCAICDQGGECDLQDQAMAYGSDHSRFDLETEDKRAVEDKDFGPLIKTSMNRCIHCTRCVRFANEIGGLPELGTTGRGNQMQIGTYVEGMLNSELSANIIDLCPVGALTSKPYAFQARPWELRKTESIDVMDAVGSSIRIDSRGPQVMRILPRTNEDINEEWLADKSRFACDGLKRQRLVDPMIRNRQTGEFSKLTWDEALGLCADKLKTSKGKVRAVAGQFKDVETLVAARDLMARLGSLDNLYFDGKLAVENNVSLPTDHSSQFRSNTSLLNLEGADCILIIGTNLRHEAPLLNARLRKNFLKNPKFKAGVIGVDKDVNLNFDYENLGANVNDLKGLVSSLESALKGSKSAKKKSLSSPFIEALRGAEKPIVLVTHSVLVDHVNGEETLKLVNKLAELIGEVLVNPATGWNGLCFVPSMASRIGALEIGWGTGHKHLEEKDFKVTLLLGADEFMYSEVPSKSSDSFTVYIGHHADRGALGADVILPAAAYTEKSATFVNLEGRVQETTPAIVPPGNAKADWKILRALSEYYDPNNPLEYDSLEELREGRFNELSPGLAPSQRTNQIIPASPWISSLAIKAFNATRPFHPHISNRPVQAFKAAAITDYYLTDVISRASPTMSKCSLMFTKAAVRNSDELKVVNVDRIANE